jgi:hypothetical protein
MRLACLATAPPLTHAIQLFGEAVEHLALSEDPLPDRLSEAYDEILPVNNDGSGPLISPALLGRVGQLKFELHRARLTPAKGNGARDLIREVLKINNLLRAEGLKVKR